MMVELVPRGRISATGANEMADANLIEFSFY